MRNADFQVYQNVLRKVSAIKTPCPLFLLTQHTLHPLYSLRTAILDGHPRWPDSWGWNELFLGPCQLPAVRLALGWAPGRRREGGGKAEPVKLKVPYPLFY